MVFGNNNNMYYIMKFLKLFDKSFVILYYENTAITCFCEFTLLCFRFRFYRLVQFYIWWNCKLPDLLCYW